MLKAKDTIMTVSRVLKTVNRYPVEDEDVGRILSAQAEATWDIAFETGDKAGYKAGFEDGEKVGIKEVIKLATAIIAGQDIATCAANNIEGHTSYLLIPLLKLKGQAGLEEWGIRVRRSNNNDL